jgi:hypothetical protein
MAFDDDLIRAAVHTGEYSDAAAERHLASVLIARRDTIGRTYVTAINPIVDPRLDSGGMLTFANAAAGMAADAADVRYEAVWSRFDNATGETTRIGDTTATSTTMAPPGPLLHARGDFIQIDIRAVSKPIPNGAGRSVRTSGSRATDGSSLDWSGCLRRGNGSLLARVRGDAMSTAAPNHWNGDAGQPAAKGLIERLLSPIADVHRR